MAGAPQTQRRAATRPTGRRSGRFLAAVELQAAVALVVDMILYADVALRLLHAGGSSSAG
jgi:hypothetical protein